MTTIEDVARLAGVSRGSVSNVLTGKVRMGDELRARVIAAAETLGYRPNRLASALASGHYSTVAVLVPDITNWVVADLVKAVEEVATERHHTVTICQTDKEVRRERAHLEELAGHRVGGLIAIAEGVDAGAYRQLLDVGTRIVLVNNRVAGLDVPIVRFDYEGAVTAALRRLSAAGRGPVGVLVPESTPSEGARPSSDVATGRLGVRRLVERCARTLGVEVIVESRETRSIADSRDAALALFQRPSPPTAILAASWPHTLGLLAVVNRLDIEERRRLHLVGTAVREYVDAIAPWLSFIDLPSRHQGHAAARRLFDAIDGREDEGRREVVIPLELVERESTPMG
jgi:LacI family transcriptional regulator